MRLAAIALLGAVAGCAADAPFACDSDAACDPGERCVDRACAAADPACPGGLRWDDSSGDRAGLCARLPDLASTPADLAVDPFPLCGNGVLDPGETCDPADPAAPCPVPADCDDRNPCTNDFVSYLDKSGNPCSAICAHDYTGHGDGTPCAFAVDGGVGAAGVCRAHACCTGCWSGSSCMGGAAVSECGAGGAGCVDCTVDAGDCVSPACGAGACSWSPLADGTGCAHGGGACSGGACCTGCLAPIDADGGVDGGARACLTGAASDACGSGGATCSVCGAQGCGVPDGGVGERCLGCRPSCAGRTCGDDGCGGSCGRCSIANDVCVAGACVCMPTPENSDAACSNGVDDDCDGLADCAQASCDGMRCSTTSGLFCSAMRCASGCRIGGVVYLAGQAGPFPCQVCDPTRDDVAWSPVADGAGCNELGAAGTCHDGACCTGCWDGTACRTGNLATACGAGGATCAICNDVNACNTDECRGGACRHSALPDGTLCGAATACGST
ncbi:MAG TPA: hypothetical protein VE987_00160, partial [Polyangiaceae bacterium]|nr:hypothetical protein [Polyangiaceae bacterium]